MILLRQNYRTQTGFTLVELAIVLVIIGLIIGGVLIGQDLIAAAEIRKQVQDIERYDAAANTFRSKYRGLPGDIRNFTQFINTTEWPDAINGDGNKLLRDADPASAGASPAIDEVTGEIAQFWHHLSIAQLIHGSYDGSSVMGEGFPIATNGACGVGIADITTRKYTNRSGGNYYQIGLISSPNPGTDDSVNNANCLTPEEAYRIDVKIDDGRPLSGKAGSVGNANGNTTGIFFGQPDYFDMGALPGNHFAQLMLNLIFSSAYAASVVALPEDACVIWFSSQGSFSQTSEYNIKATGVNCQLAVKAAF